VFEQWRWLDSIYPPYVRAFHVFIWAEGKDDWDRNEGCNISRLREAHQMLTTYANSQPQPEPEPEYDMKPYIVTHSGGKSLNVYANKTSLNVSPITTFPSGARVLADLAADPPMNDWVRVQVNGGIKGWTPRQRSVVTWTLEDDPAATPAPPEADDPRWRARLAVPTSGTRTNIRRLPATVGTPLGTLATGGGMVHTIPEHLLTAQEKEHATRADGFWHVLKVLLTEKTVVGYVREDVVNLYELGDSRTALEQWRDTTQRTIDRLRELRTILENEIALQHIIVEDIEQRIEKEKE